MSLPKFTYTLKDIIKEKRVSQNEVTELRLWMKDERYPEVCDEMIVMFILACKRNLEASRKAINSYFILSFLYPSVFNNRDVDSDELQRATHTAFHATMPVRTDDNYVIHMFRLNDTRYYNFHFESIAKLCFMLTAISMNKKSPPAGLKVVVDARGAGLMHLTRFKLKVLKGFIEYLQEGLPMHMNEIHVINTILMVDKLLFLIKPFMKPELYQMLHLHPNNTDMDEFSKNYIPKKCLPADYGGALPSFEELNQETIAKYRELKQFFEDEESIRKDWRPN